MCSRRSSGARRRARRPRRAAPAVRGTRSVRSRRTTCGTSTCTMSWSRSSAPADASRGGRGHRARALRALPRSPRSTRSPSCSHDAAAPSTAKPPCSWSAPSGTTGRHAGRRCAQRRALPWLPDDAVVEVPCRIHRSGAAPGTAPDLTLEQRGLVQHVAAYERLAVGRGGDRRRRDRVPRPARPSR